ncbi:YceI family protein [Hufsiella ginkgonis]|uniref:YceI family protein n=1 Tax=Hufsiella ginkgonis TaxID=2695274 RepID=A0A7K1XSE8_9SPHI|nr:YceI family protein [Hufsiella ginkgonis]MXV13872.1 YceI family protein [Hufsiella ginkgonis]
MKKTLAFLSVLAALSLSAFVAKKDETYTVDVSKSSIEWIGRKVTGQHTGTVKIASGNLIYNGATLKGGTFTMDMNSVVTTDGSGARLETHLKSPDFFGVEKNPTSTFTVTKVAPAGGDQVNITGNLTIKGITKPLTFPATVKKQGNAIAAVAKGVKVDRTKYDIKYNSKSIFAAIGDKAIDDEFELAINLVATK